MLASDGCPLGVGWTDLEQAQSCRPTGAFVRSDPLHDHTNRWIRAEFAYVVPWFHVLHDESDLFKAMQVVSDYTERELTRITALNDVEAQEHYYVTFEYNRSVDESVLNQGHFYLDDQRTVDAAARARTPGLCDDRMNAHSARVSVGPRASVMCTPLATR